MMLATKEKNKEKLPCPFLFYLKHWFSSRLFSGNPEISTINQIVALLKEAVEQIPR